MTLSTEEIGFTWIGPNNNSLLRKNRSRHIANEFLTRMAHLKIMKFNVIGLKNLGWAPNNFIFPQFGKNFPSKLLFPLEDEFSYVLMIFSIFFLAPSYDCLPLTHKKEQWRRNWPNQCNEAFFWCNSNVTQKWSFSQFGSKRIFYVLLALDPEIFDVINGFLLYFSFKLRMLPFIRPRRFLLELRNMKINRNSFNCGGMLFWRLTTPWVSNILLQALLCHIQTLNVNTGLLQYLAPARRTVINVIHTDFDNVKIGDFFGYVLIITAELTFQYFQTAPIAFFAHFLQILQILFINSKELYMSGKFRDLTKAICVLTDYCSIN